MWQSCSGGTTKQDGDPRVTSALIGARNVASLAGLINLTFTDAEMADIDICATDGGLNIWAGSSTL